MAETDRMGRCARLAWDHAVEGSQRSPIARPGVTSGHILLGVLKEQSCAGGLVLGKMGIDFGYALALTEFVLQYGRQAGPGAIRATNTGPSSPDTPPRPFLGDRDAPETATVEWAGVPHTAPAKQVLDLCVEEANLFTPTYPIGTEHLLLSLLRVDGIASRVLNYLGIDEAKARSTRDEIWSILRGEE